MAINKNNANEILTSECKPVAKKWLNMVVHDEHYINKFKTGCGIKLRTRNYLMRERQPQSLPMCVYLEHDESGNEILTSWKEDKITCEACIKQKVYRKAQDTMKPKDYIIDAEFEEK